MTTTESPALDLDATDWVIARDTVAARRRGVDLSLARSSLAVAQASALVARVRELEADAALAAEIADATRDFQLREVSPQIAAQEAAAMSPAPTDPTPAAGEGVTDAENLATAIAMLTRVGGRWVPSSQLTPMALAHVQACGGDDWRVVDSLGFAWVPDEEQAPPRFALVRSRSWWLARADREGDADVSAGAPAGGDEMVGECWCGAPIPNCDAHFCTDCEMGPSLTVDEMHEFAESLMDGSWIDMRSVEAFERGRRLAALAVRADRARQAADARRGAADDTLSRVLHKIQLLQPAGSPPPGDVEVHVDWIVRDAQRRLAAPGADDARPHSAPIHAPDAPGQQNAQIHAPNAQPALSPAQTESSEP